eukprot:14635526-Ditylum_brightwellii.AAC.1
MNTILKAIWNLRLVPAAIESEMIHPVQFDTILSKIITMDKRWLFCLNGALLNNNADTYYDRMIPEVTTMNLQVLDMPGNASKHSVLTNKQRKRHNKTADGISKELYGHTEEFGNLGKSQGKASSPQNWHFQNSMLLAALTALYMGVGWFLRST